MLFSRPLTIDSTLSVTVTRARMRACATPSAIADLATFRHRQIIGWRLSQTGESFLFQPEYGDSLSVDGARFVGLVEPMTAGSRIRGRVVASPLTRVVMSVWMLAAFVATAVALGQGQQGQAKVLAIAALMFSAALLMVRYSLWSTSRLVETRLRQSLSGATARAVA
jgi:hypothetical protein